MTDKETETLSYLIRQWIEDVEEGSRFTTRQIDSDIGIETRGGKDVRRQILKEYCDTKRVQRIPNLAGVYRRVDSYLGEMDWQRADPENTVRLKFPFELEKYVKIFPKSIIIVAGAKNAGKTLFLYLMTVMNMDKFCIDLYNTETGEEQMKERFDSIDVEIPNPAPFKVFERYDNFADVIEPDHISIIDYLDVGSETYMVGDEIDKIFRRINQVAIIAIQKPPGRDLGYGKGFTEKRAVLYLAMDTGKLKIVHAKNPAQPTVNPNNKQWSYWVEHGARFMDIKPYYGEGY